LPYPGGEFAEQLSRAELLPVGHPRLESLVGEILGAERDALTAARRLAQWVFEYLEKTPSIGIPEAIAVLDAGRGDCNEHAALFTALARTAGLPAQLVAGLVYVDGRFVYHAWSEVRGASGWLPVDPALGQVPADATHIALVYGDLSAQAALIPIVGRLRLEVVE
jgi:transglutaminase-like putative cysteine protease